MRCSCFPLIWFPSLRGTVQAEKLTEGTKNAPYAPGRSACRAVITTKLMMAVTVSEKPASLALPVSESVNLVEKIVIGRRSPAR